MKLTVSNLNNMKIHKVKMFSNNLDAALNNTYPLWTQKL